MLFLYSYIPPISIAPLWLIEWKTEHYTRLDKAEPHEPYLQNGTIQEFTGEVGENPGDGSFFKNVLSEGMFTCALNSVE